MITITDDNNNIYALSLKLYYKTSGDKTDLKNFFVGNRKGHEKYTHLSNLINVDSLNQIIRLHSTKLINRNLLEAIERDMKGHPFSATSHVCHKTSDQKIDHRISLEVLGMDVKTYPLSATLMLLRCVHAALGTSHTMLKSSSGRTDPDRAARSLT